MRRLGLTSSLLVLTGACSMLGCGPLSEDVSIELRAIDEQGALVGAHASTSASGALVELDWTTRIDNRSSQPCAVAVYRWLDVLDPELELPSALTPDDYPPTWAGAELIDAGFVDGIGSLSVESLEADAAESITAQIGIAACPGASLDVGVGAQLRVDLGVRAVFEATTLELWAL